MCVCARVRACVRVCVRLCVCVGVYNPDIPMVDGSCTNLQLRRECGGCWPASLSSRLYVVNTCIDQYDIT